jgi:peptide/nickel transport system substrate-binding protein
MVRRCFWAVVVVVATLLASNIHVPTSVAAEKTFTYSFPVDLISLDPQSTRVVYNVAFLANIYEPLVRLDASYNAESSLATGWERIAPSTWRFHLRQGVTFNSGNPFTANDVKFSIDRAKDERSPYRGLAANIASVKIIDDATIEIETKGTDPILLRELPALLILDSKFVTEHNAVAPLNAATDGENYLSRNTSGTGPYTLVKYQPGVAAELTANPTWWDTANKSQLIPHMIYKPIKSDATRVAALLSGEIDLIDPLPVDDIPRIKATPGFQAIVAPGTRTILLGFDVKNDELAGSDVKGKNPFKDLRVRQAVYQAIDNKALVDRIMNGLATPAAILMATGITGYDAAIDKRDQPYDPDAAKKLLADAGYPSGFSFTLDCPAGRYVNDEKVCLALVPMWAKIGLKVNLVTRPPALYFTEIAKGQSNLFVTGYGTDLVLDGNLFLVDVAHTLNKKSYGAGNYGGYSNARVDELTEKAQSELDPIIRNGYLRDAYAELKKDIAFFPLYNENIVWGARANVEAKPTVNDILWLYRVRFK